MRIATAAVWVALVGALAGCGGGGVSTATPDARPGSGVEVSTRDPRAPRPPRLTLSHCPTGHPACRTTKGRIVYIEHVDPDGDGDAHFVIVDPQGISLPGITAIDVRRGLRPHPLPHIGDRVSAAGPVQTGSYGQSQIHALELHVAGE